MIAKHPYKNKLIVVPSCFIGEVELGLSRLLQKPYGCRKVPGPEPGGVGF